MVVEDGRNERKLLARQSPCRGSRQDEVRAQEARPKQPQGFTQCGGLPRVRLCDQDAMTRSTYAGWPGASRTKPWRKLPL